MELPPHCIYCTQPADSSEHWMPRGFGAIKNMSLLTGRLCHECNQTLGRTLDEEILRTGPTGLFRSALGIKGRKGHSEVSPFYYRSSAAVQPTAMTMPSPRGPHEVLTELIPNRGERQSARLLRQIVVKRSDGSLSPVPFPMGWQPEQLRNALALRDLIDSELVEVFLGPDESADNPDSPESYAVRETLTAVFGRFRAKVWYGEGEAELKWAELSLGISRTYVRALAKVAFHYLLWTSNIWRGDEAEFNSLRRFIRYDEGDWQTYVHPVVPPFLGPIRNGYLPDAHTHFLVADIEPAQVVVFMQFFVGPDSNPAPPAAKVRLAVSPRQVADRKLVGHMVRYHHKKRDGYDAELHPFDVAIAD